MTARRRIPRHGRPRSARAPSATLALLTLALALSASRAAADEAGEEISTTDEGEATVQIEIQVTRKLRLTPRGLRGAVKVTFRNAGESAVEMLDPEVHGLVFREAESGDLFVLVHPCQCVRDSRHPEAASRIALEPGQDAERDIEEFGCGGSSWRPPPRGTYDLTYRIHRASGTPPGTPEVGEGSPQDLTEECRQRFSDEAYWADAFRSAPLSIRLR